MLLECKKKKKKDQIAVWGEWGQKANQGKLRGRNDKTKKKQKWKNKAGREVGMDRKLRRLARYQGENLKAQRCV